MRTSASWLAVLAIAVSCCESVVPQARVRVCRDYCERMEACGAESHNSIPDECGEVCVTSRTWGGSCGTAYRALLECTAELDCDGLARYRDESLSLPDIPCRKEKTAFDSCPRQ